MIMHKDTHAHRNRTKRQLVESIKYENTEILKLKNQLVESINRRAHEES